MEMLWRGKNNRKLFLLLNNIEMNVKLSYLGNFAVISQMHWDSLKLLQFSHWCYAKHHKTVFSLVSWYMFINICNRLPEFLKLGKYLITPSHDFCVKKCHDFSSDKPEFTKCFGQCLFLFNCGPSQIDNIHHSK